MTTVRYWVYSGDVSSGNIKWFVRMPNGESVLCEGFKKASELLHELRSSLGKVKK